MTPFYRHRAYPVKTGKLPFAERVKSMQGAAVPKQPHNPGTLPDRILVGRRLTAMREALGLLKSELADQLRCDRTTWGKYEVGDRDLTLAVAWRIFRLYGFSLDFLFDGKAYGIPEQYRNEVIRRLNGGCHS